MEEKNDALGMLDLLIPPGFCVKDNEIVKVNQPAQSRQVPLGADINDQLLTGKEEFSEFREGCLYLTLELAGQPWGASVTRVGDYRIFLLEEEYERSELQALALAARELRGPLADIMTTADRVFPAAVREDAGAQEQIALLNRGLFKMLRIISNMSDADRSSIGTFQGETLDVGAFLESVFAKAGALVSHARLQLSYEGLREPVYSLINPEKLERAVLNILSNAIKFTPAGGNIDAKLIRRGKMLYLTVQDSGSGIPENLRGNVYTRYLRQPAVEEGRLGIGLGMVIVRGAASQHGGTVLIDHPRDQGTRVTMTLAIRQNKDPMVRSRIQGIDYAGGRDHGLIELSDCLPWEAYDPRKVN